MFEKMLKLLPGIGLFIDFRGGRGLFVAFDQRRCGGAKPANMPEPAAPAPPAVIPLANIAARATEVSNLLSSLTAAAVPGAQIESIAKALPDLSESVIR